MKEYFIVLNVGGLKMNKETKKETIDKSLQEAIIDASNQMAGGKIGVFIVLDKDIHKFKIAFIREMNSDRDLENTYDYLTSLGKDSINYFG